jgi:hypothetical protein
MSCTPDFWFGVGQGFGIGILFSVVCIGLFSLFDATRRK